MNFELTADQRGLQELVAKFAQKEIAQVAEQLDRDGQFPTALFRRIGELGITSIPFSTKYGGMGLGTFEMALAIEQLAKADQSIAVTTMVSVAAGLILERFGNEQQKDEFLPALVRGEALGALAGTEADAGSDTAGFKTHASFKDDQWTVNGSKAYITNAGTELSTYALTLVVSSSPDAESKEFTLFIIPRGTKGYTQGEPYKKMGWKSSDTRPLYFDDCVIPSGNILGKVGQGRALLHKGYQQARVFLSACSVGLADAALDHAVKYAQERKAFGSSIGGFQLIQKMAADMAVKVETARLLTYRAAWLADHNKATVKDLAMAKYYATEVATEVASLAIQIHGGWGFMDDCPVSRYYRDNRVCTIGDGSSQIQIQLIARGLGLDVKFGG